MTNTATVCDNGIGSSLLLKVKVEATCKEMGIEANVESCDSNATVEKGADPFVTIKGPRSVFSDDQRVTIIKGYTSREKIGEDSAPILEGFK